MQINLPKLKTNSTYFILSITALIIFSSFLAFVPRQTWKNLFSGKFYNFATVFSSTPNSSGYIINGEVATIVPDLSGGVYVGGYFTSVLPNVAYGATLSVSTELITRNFPIINGIVWASVPDGSGGWYIGGTFTKVGTLTRNHVARVLSNGTVDSNFNPNASDIVFALELSPNGSTLYLGGDFTSVSGTTRNHVAAVNTSDGSLVTGFDPNTGGSPYSDSSYTGSVRSFKLSSNGSTLYMGGYFLSVGGITRNLVAAINTSNGSLVTAFNANIDPGDLEFDAFSVSSFVFSSDGNILYIGGNFTNVGGTSRLCLAAVNTSDGSLITGFNPRPDNPVYSMAISSDGSKLYLGGFFTNIGTTTRNRLAAVNTSDGSLITGFNPNANNTVYGIALSPDGNTLYMGGDFTSIGGTTRNHVATVNTSNGSLVTGFDPNANGIVHSVSTSESGSIVFIGGAFTQIGSITRNHLVHFLSDGSVDTNFDPNANGAILSIALSSSTNLLYVGGSFTTIAGASRYNIAAIDASDGSLDTLNLGASGAINSLALSPDGNTLYIGGEFTTIGRIYRSRIAAVHTVDGSMITDFSHDVNGSVYATALSPDGNTLYLGGAFDTVGITSRNHIAAVDVSTPSGSLTAFNPSPDDQVFAIAPSPDGNTVYIGGAFTSMVSGSIIRNRIAQVDSSTGSTTDFNPGTDNQVFTLNLSSDGSKLYLGGQFSQVNGTTRNVIAAVSTTDGSVDDFDPDIDTGSFREVLTTSLSLDGNTLYMGGDFIIPNGPKKYASFPVVPTRHHHLLINPAPTTTSTSTGLSLQLNAVIVDDSGTPITGEGFEYGLTTAYGSKAIATGTSETGAFSVTLTDLLPNIVYHYRAYATNAYGTVVSSDFTFTLSDAGTLISFDATPITILTATSTEPIITKATSTPTSTSTSTTTEPLVLKAATIPPAPTKPQEPTQPKEITATAPAKAQEPTIPTSISEPTAPLPTTSGFMGNAITNIVAGITQTYNQTLSFITASLKTATDFIKEKTGITTEIILLIIEIIILLLLIIYVISFISKDIKKENEYKTQTSSPYLVLSCLLFILLASTTLVVPSESQNILLSDIGNEYSNLTFSLNPSNNRSATFINSNQLIASILASDPNTFGSLPIDEEVSNVLDSFNSKYLNINYSINTDKH